MMNNLIKLCFVTLLLAFVSSVYAQQLHFSKVENDESYQFNYQWQDIENKPQSLNFALTKSILFNQFRDFKTFKPKMAERHISKSVVKYLRKEPINGVIVTYNALSEGINISSKSQQKLSLAQRKIGELKDQFAREYLNKNHYHYFKTHNNVQAIKPDHAKFAKMSVDDLKPIKSIILDKVSIKNIRKATNYILGFVQSIPYSRLESRVDSAGAGFNPPLKVLWENQGDCDSKVTLTASLLRTLMPRIKMVLVFIDNHALIGIDVLPQGDEINITVDGVTYLLAEPTGPAKYPLGTLDETSKLAISQGQYTAEKFN